MRKKGFTLIELLAVIIILAIVALIATPIVLNVVDAVRISANRSSAYLLIDGATNYYAESMLDESKKVKLTGITNLLDDLSLENKPKQGIVYINKDGQVAVAVVYGKTCFTKNFTDSKLTESEDIDNCVLEKTYKCKRATELHTEICQQEENEYGIHCAELGYTTGSIITYGNLGTKGTFSSGDAFDCDVNGDGVYDAATERFYYVSDLYNTTSQTFDNKYAVLIYYSSTVDGIANNAEYSNRISNLFTYNNQVNYQGPVNLAEALPTTNQWSNISLSNNNRAIITDTGATSTAGGNLPISFSYTKEVEGVTIPTAARLLTTQEIKNGCNTTIVEENMIKIEGCNYLLENTTFSTESLYQTYWLENPLASDRYNAWEFNASTSFIGIFDGPPTLPAAGVRPVIEVLKTEIE